MKTILLFLLLISNTLYASEIIFIDSLNDAIKVSNQKKLPVLLIFGQNTCGYCEKIKNDINSGELDNLLEDKVVCYVDISKDKTLSKEYNINGIPDSRIYYRKNLKAKIIGYNKQKYKQWLSEN